MAATINKKSAVPPHIPCLRLLLSGFISSLLTDDFLNLFIYFFFLLSVLLPGEAPVGPRGVELQPCH